MLGSDCACNEREKQVSGVDTNAVCTVRVLQTSEMMAQNAEAMDSEAYDVASVQVNTRECCHEPLHM